MKHKLLKLLALAFACTAVSAFAVACSGGDLGNSSSSTTSSSETSVEENTLSFKTFTVDGTNVYGKVSNATEDFSFANELQTSGNTSFMVAKDKYGSQTYLTKTVPLEIGDNVYYVFEMNGENVVNTYTVTLRRKPIYTVSFNTQGGTDITTQQVEEDGFAIMPETEPTREGYTFTGWNFDFSQPITESVTVMPNWKGNPYEAIITVTLARRCYNCTSFQAGTGVANLIDDTQNRGWRSENVPTESAPQAVWFALETPVSVTKLDFDNDMTGTALKNYKVYYSESSLDRSNVYNKENYTLLCEETDGMDTVVEYIPDEAMTIGSLYIEIFEQENKEGDAVVASLDKVYFYQEVDPETYKGVPTAW